MSPALLAEVAQVLSRPRIRRRLSAEDARLFLADVAVQVVMVADPANPLKVAATRRTTTSSAPRTPPAPRRWWLATTVDDDRYRDSKPASDE